MNKKSSNFVKKWTKFQTKAQKCSKVHFMREIWCSNREIGRFDEKLGDSRENRESWQVWVLMHQSIPAAPEHLPHPQVWPWGWQRPDPQAGQNLLMPHPRDDKAAMAGWMQLSLTDASTMNRISLENNCLMVLSISRLVFMNCFWKFFPLGKVTVLFSYGMFWMPNIHV